jgi:hypothetical protein
VDLDSIGRRRAVCLGLTLVVFAVVACDDDDPAAPSGSTGAGTAGSGVGGVDPGDPFPVSAKASVRMKTATQLRRDLAAVLALDPDTFCTELGAFSCNEIHGIRLSETDAYEGGFYEPLAETIISSPAAVDRMALIACAQRAEQDLEAPAGAIIFAGLPITGGALTDPTAPAVDAPRPLHGHRVQRHARSRAAMGQVVVLRHPVHVGIHLLLRPR